MTTPARAVLGIACDACPAVFMLNPGDHPECHQLYGDELAWRAWPHAQAAGWHTTEDQTRRCPTCVAAMGKAPLTRPTWAHPVRL